MNETPRDLLDFAVEVARRAGDETLLHFRTDLEVEAKADSSPVTVADRAAEQRARELIIARFPDDGIIGEEHGTTRPDARRRWILDPIDGTLSFVQGVPLYGVLVAVEEGSQSIVGVIHFPALGETVFAALGEGCWWDGSPARVSRVDSIAEALVLCTDAEGIERRGHSDGWNALRARARMVRTWGDCYGHALVATGRAEAMIDPILARWDAAALAPITSEAGGVYTDWSGEPTHLSDSGIATNLALAAAVRRLLGCGRENAR
ncbi:MAG: inositol monophosphatase family protein [Acidobacteriota bacterium]|jgi:histidinol phosphatase-like enzyme (inositol monophosphatase family)